MIIERVIDVKTFSVTDTIGQPHTFNVFSKDGKNAETVRLSARGTVHVHADELPQEIMKEKDLGLVFVREENVSSSKKSEVK